MKINHQVHGRPKAMLIHNPGLSGCLKTLNQKNYSSLLFVEPPDIAKASEEHSYLVKLLDDCGVQTIELFDLIGNEHKVLLSANPNAIFTRDPLVTLPWMPGIGIVGKMAKKVRQPETDAIAKIASLLGLKQIIYLPENVTCEGGDVLPVNINGKRVIFIRTGGRTSPQILDFLTDSKLSICDEVVEVHCRPNTLHLDSVVGFAGKDIVVYEPDAITRTIIHHRKRQTKTYLCDYLKTERVDTLAVSKYEAKDLQATNFVNIDDETVVAYSNCQRVLDELASRNIKTLSFKGIELAKGLGGPRCLTRPIYT